MPKPAAQFVLLRHVLSDDAHWDLMLDTGSTLATWQLHDDPTALAADTAGTTEIRARRLNDHRRAYLDYEGPISGGRGQVTRTDSGIYRTEGRREDVWRILLEGRLLRGEFQLTRNPDASWSLRRLSGS
jgi:hypothetical protein